MTHNIIFYHTKVTYYSHEVLLNSSTVINHAKCEEFESKSCHVPENKTCYYFLSSVNPDQSELTYVEEGR